MHRSHCKGVAFWLALQLFCCGAQAAEVALRLLDADASPASSVALVLEELDGQTLPEPAAAAPPAVMDQVDQQFVPALLVVRQGTLVAFPNSDQIRHHVYSFSPVKRFELSLYRGNQHEPILFDRPGLVVVGCNIHDQMVGYIYVVDSPYFGVTAADGRARIAGVPPGRYRVSAWHPGMDVPVALFADLTVSDPGIVAETRVASGWHSPQQMAMTWHDY